MVDIGTAPGSTNTAKILVSENNPGTMLIIGADTGAPDGPGRKVDVFEDVEVHGNASVGEMKVVRLRFPQGVNGSINQGVDDEVPRIQKLVGDASLHIIGGGPLNGPSRDVVLWDDVQVANDLVVNNNLTVTNDATVANNLTVNTAAVVGTTLTVNGTGPHSFGGDVDLAAGANLNVGDLASGWGRVKAENAVFAAGTFHIWDGPRTVGGTFNVDLKCGFGFDILPGAYALSGNTNQPSISGLPSVHLVLEAPILCSSVVVTPWVTGHYDETIVVPGNPVILAASGPGAINATVLAKGFPPAPGVGVSATPSSCLQQIEIGFFDLVAGAPVIPVDGSPPIDIVFDVKICGCECTA